MNRIDHVRNALRIAAPRLVRLEMPRRVRGTAEGHRWVYETALPPAVLLYDDRRAAGRNYNERTWGGRALYYSCSEDRWILHVRYGKWYRNVHGSWWEDKVDDVDDEYVVNNFDVGVLLREIQRLLVTTYADDETMQAFKRVAQDYFAAQQVAALPESATTTNKRRKRR